jgi:glycosyltransferase involved in cell wall biosynthesis
MKLLFDARYIRTDFHDGISRYSMELGNALAKLTSVTFLVCDPAQLQFLPKKADVLFIHAPISAKEPFTASILNQYKPDVVVSPMQTMGTAGRKYKVILTSHDMIYYRHHTPPKQLPWYIRAGWLVYHATYIPQRLKLNSADIVATVSHTVKAEFEQANLTHQPIIVVPNAPQRFATYPVSHKSPVQNIVYMGSFMPYKNVETLVRTMEYLPGRTLHLLSKIAPNRRAELQKLIPEDADVRFYSGVTDDQYEAVLANNAVLVTASLDEGYGLPIAEALAMGVPAVVSDIPIFHEVAASGALYADPSKPKEFAKRILMLDDSAVYEKVTHAGKQQSDTFSWKASAQELLRAIKSLM